MLNSLFRLVATRISTIAGSPVAFIISLLIIVLWLSTGDYFDYSDTWQLIINTGTTIVTFLMVFLIQNTQNRDSLATHLKLDELIRAQKGARNFFVDAEELSDEELDELQKDFEQFHKQASSRILHHIHRQIATEHAKRRGGSFLEKGVQALEDSYEDFERKQGLAKKSRQKGKGKKQG